MNNKLIYKNMSAEEDRIQKQIRPCIEKMVMDLTRQKPQDVVRK
jgi:hypothetical protein